jgi:hypothetical protein
MVEMIWKEAVVVYSRYSLRIFPEGLTKTTKTLSQVTGIQPEIWTKHLQNRSLELYLVDRLFAYIFRIKFNAEFYNTYIQSEVLITVAAQSEAWTVFACSNAGIIGSNPTQGMDDCVFVYSVFMLSCV